MHVWTANKPEHIQLVKDADAEAVDIPIIRTEHWKL